MSAPVFVPVNFGPTAAPGNFSIAHGLGRAPYGVMLAMNSAGAVWVQVALWDATDILLVASDAGLTGRLMVW